MHTHAEFNKITNGEKITGRPFTVTRETIADFALGSWTSIRSTSTKTT